MNPLSAIKIMGKEKEVQDQKQDHEGKTENDQKQTPPTRILPTTAGRELDALIAEKVMGWTMAVDVNDADRLYRAGGLWYRVHDYPVRRSGWVSLVTTNGINGAPSQSDIWNPSTRIALAWVVVEKMRAQGWVHATVQSFPSYSEAPEWDDATMKVEWWAEFSRYRSPVEATSPHCDSPALAICLAALASISPSTQEEKK